MDWNACGGPLMRLLGLLTLILPVCESIILRNVGVPSYAIQGKEAVLSCDYDLEGQQLYAVKWYKNGLEFYRFLPSSAKATTIYARPGVNVDPKRSGDREVTLTGLAQKSTGRYRCEVSTEAPSFATVSNYGDMVVVVPPKSGPTIRGGKSRYRPGDRVDVNCTSELSKPAADLVWFVNGRPAEREQLVRYPIYTSAAAADRDLHTSTLGLRFSVNEEHFPRGGGGDGRAMKLKCTASIGGMYWKSNEKSAEGLKQKRGAASNMEGLAGDDPGTDFDGLSSAFAGRASADAFGSTTTVLGALLATALLSH